MKIQLKSLSIVTVLATTFALGGCANLSHHDRNVVSGAGIGALAGAVLTGGSSVGTVGGAAVGGVIGSTIGRR
ncbi:glycine zipper 2TM domain-containing protein [Rhodoferax sp.]|uniref:glycine zipper 2TM domain-containing protein n=1 Tax=Rhodoferax sp. TaxID=50421 RepID=UPI0028496071|nr:glycine zipper 2TM domain-containing protein [Rhodoferax sp.]MDR3371138.1 glycine zipper 2TM domain-containing protein [Rhodoferax sp.]